MSRNWIANARRGSDSLGSYCGTRLATMTTPAKERKDIWLERALWMIAEEWGLTRDEALEWIDNDDYPWPNLTPLG